MGGEEVSYTIAPSVKAALAQATALWPQRSTAADGTIGDAAHAARTSDHNPDERGIVHAFDLTHDRDHGVDCHVLAQALRTRVLSGDEKRVKYVIWYGRIFDPAVSKEWRAYNGANAHKHHMHVSILSGTGPENDVRAWWTAVTAPPSSPTLWRNTVNGVHVTSRIIDIPLDGDGKGAAPICPEGKLISLSPWAEHAAYAGDNDTIIWLVGAHHYQGTTFAAVKGGAPNGTAHAYATVAD